MRQIFPRTVFTFLAFITCTTGADTQAPTSGLLYNTTEVHSMAFSCEYPSNEKLTCKFEQASVRPKAKIEDLPKIIDAASKQFRKEKPPTQQDCNMYREMAAVFEGAKQAPKPEVFATMSSVEKKDELQAIKAFLTYCSKPTQENYLNIVKIDHEKSRRTCQVSVNTFQQTFKYLNSGNNQTAWVVQSEPEGPCGVVQLSRLEPEEITIGKSKFTHWKYIARKAITNPTGEWFSGMKCSELDENSYVYDWRAKTHQRTCDYIEF
jgi:hypothetical protein